MSKVQYSKELCKQLRDKVDGMDLLYRPIPLRYEDGDTLEYTISGVWPETTARARFKIQKFIGGGFAGQVYRCLLEEIDSEEGDIPGLKKGGIYGVKIIIPPSKFSIRFRNAVYWLAFQGPFSSQVNRDAVRAGVLWRKLVRRACRITFGEEDAASDVFATFHDDKMMSYGEVAEWVEGRTWKLETDTHPEKRKMWRDVDPLQTESPEFVAKKQFMNKMVEMLHSMGGYEFARQYEWWTMKSQPNVLKRFDRGEGPADGLCAIDFRAGLALLPYLPMSPGDIPLIVKGFVRGAFAQFDRVDIKQLRDYIDLHKADFTDMSDLVAAFEQYDRKYRRSLPDLLNRGWNLLTDRTLAKDVKNGLIEGYQAKRLIDDDFADELRSSGLKFFVFYLMGAIPWLGEFWRKLWGNDVYGSHFLFWITRPKYFAEVNKASVAHNLIRWHHKGRVGKERAELLLRQSYWFWIQRFTLNIIFAPFPKIHRAVTEPSYVRRRIKEKWTWMRQFFKDPQFREKWLEEDIVKGHAEGMLSDSDRDDILGKIKEPMIITYLKSVGVHFATLPVTQIISVITGTIVYWWIIASGKGGKEEAALAFGGVLLLFQLTPISPGSICRGVYVLYLMKRDRDVQDYLIAAPLSFVKYIGYLAFPIQMVATYPALSQFLASRWAQGAVSIIPVFGEKGALMEHFVFSQFFNKPRIFGRWAGQRIVALLNGWMVFGVILVMTAIKGCNLDPAVKKEFAKIVNLLIAMVVLFILPRILFYPMMRKNQLSGEKK